MINLIEGIRMIGEVRVRNHLILAAGILGTTGSSLIRIRNSGAGAVVTKSIGPLPKTGHIGPCVIPLPYGLINAMGLPNPSDSFLPEIEKAGSEYVIASIFGGSPEEFRNVASWFRGKVSGLELNLSCPHAEGYGASIGSDPEIVEACTREVKKEGLPVWVKLTPNVTDITECGLAAQKGGADAIVAINTVKAMRISIPLKRPVLGNRYGGLSGPAIFPIALRCVYELYEACNIPIIGCGGISTSEDVIEMMMAGAQAVEIGTAAGKDPGIFKKMSDNLYNKEGIEDREIVGCAHEF